MESRAHKFQMFSPLIIIFHIYMLLLFVISGFKYKNQFIVLAQQNLHIEFSKILRTWMTMQQHQASTDDTNNQQ